VHIVGLLPIGGNGTRLGMPFPKPLSPIITSGGVMPVYKHTLTHVRVVTHDVYALVRPITCSCMRAAVKEDDVDLIITAQANLPAALGEAGRFIARVHGKSVMVLTALPDSIWKLDPERSLWDVVRAARQDGALALFRANADQLDDVIIDGPRVKSVETKKPGATGEVNGWGAFLIRAGALAEFSDRAKDGPQLGELDMGWALLGDYIDLGTQERYINHHDTRSWNG